MIEFEQHAVELIETPVKIDLRDLDIESNKCQTNAYKVSRRYPDYTFVEGVIVIKDAHGNGDILAHAWNKNKTGHFDVTAPLWISEEHRKITEILYYPVKGFELSEMKPTGQFSKETTSLVSYHQIIQDWKFKPDTNVVLFDQISGKPVNHGIVNNYDSDTNHYHIMIHRLGNEFLYAWHEDFIQVSTPELVELADDFLNEVEMGADHLLGGQQVKDRAMDTVLEIPLSVPPYIVYYIQMNIGGAVKWRLLTLKTHTPAD